MLMTPPLTTVCQRPHLTIKGQQREKAYASGLVAASFLAVALIAQNRDAAEDVQAVAARDLLVAGAPITAVDDVGVATVVVAVVLAAVAVGARRQLAGILS